MEINAKLIAAALFTAVLAIPQVQAQSSSGPAEPTPPIALNAPNMDRPDGPGGRHQPGGPGKHRGGPQSGRPERKGMGTGLTSLTTVSGTVGQWVGNDDGVLDGFTFTGSANTAVAVKFPLHLGQQIQKAVKPGSSASVTGYTETNPQGEARFRMTSLTAGKTTVFDAPPVAPTTMPATPTMTTVTGKIADYRLGQDGRVNGLVLDDKTIVRIPPHVAYQLTNLATKGGTITVQGYPKNIRDGQVQLEKTNILNASVLTINGQQYLIR